MTTHEAEQLAVLASEVGELKNAVASLDVRLFGNNGDGLITRFRIIEHRVNTRLWLERALFGGVAALIAERFVDLVMAAPLGAALAVPLAVPL